MQTPQRKVLSQLGIEPRILLLRKATMLTTQPPCPLFKLDNVKKVLWISKSDQVVFVPKRNQTLTVVLSHHKTDLFETELDDSNTISCQQSILVFNLKDLKMLKIYRTVLNLSPCIRVDAMSQRHISQIVYE